MDVSRLTISEETRSRLNREMKLTPKDKKRIRCEGIKQYVDLNKGRKLRAKELYAAAGYRVNDQKSQWNAASFIKNIKDDGILIQKGKSWSPCYYEVDLSKLDNYKKRKKSKNIVNVPIEDLTKVPTMTFGIREDKVAKEADEYTPAPELEIKKDDNPLSEGLTISYPKNEREFSFELVIREKLDHGLKELGSISMTATDQSTMKELSNQLIDRI